ncbi:MAG: hypothetical protein LC721_08560 [Actinobacteria bacterium]|nr:hypothetical protein [Actinomycetota bacterium]
MDVAVVRRLRFRPDFHRGDPGAVQTTATRRLRKSSSRSQRAERNTFP